MYKNILCQVMRGEALFQYHIMCRLAFQAESLTWRRQQRHNAGKGLYAVAYTDAAALNQVTQAKQSTSLSAKQLHRSALLARLSGLCYYPPDQLASRLRDEGMKLVISGGTSFTRWYVADGALDQAPSTQQEPTAKQTRNGDAQPAAFPSSTSQAAATEVERVIMLRGVVWRGEGVDSFKLWQDLMRFWPSPLATEHTVPAGVLLAHTGAADMAEKVYEPLRIAVQEGVALKRRLVFAGHSLGGSLALLLALLFKLRMAVPAELLQATTFGSPPTISHRDSKGGDGILQVAGLQREAIQNFVLENDPVPRALLSIDPTFTALKNNRAGAAFLQLRHLLVGPGFLTPDRFLADNLGEVHLIRWTPETGHKVVALAPEEIEKELRMVSEGQTPSSFQSVVDHAHGSYSTDLEAAAWQLQARGPASL